MFHTELTHVQKIALISSLILFLVGIVLIVAFTGHAFLGMALIGIAILVAFTVWCTAMHNSFPKTVKILRCIIYGLVIIGSIYFCVVESAIIKDAKTNTEQSADYLIVLGAGVNGTTPSLSLHDRLVGAYDYMTENPDCIAVVSGGQGPGEDITEAKCMRDWLIAHGISDDRIIMEDQATSTLENLQYSMNIITQQTGKDCSEAIIGVVSSEYHLHRAKCIAESLDMDIIGVAARTSFPTVALNYFIREAFAMTEIYVFGVR